MCDIQLYRPDELSEEHWSAWRRIQEARPDLDSPFFSPGLTRAVASVRPDVEIAVISDSGRIVGFFPFQRGPRGVAQSVAGRLSEFHGVIDEQGAAWNPEQLLDGCRLNSWHFDHLPVSQATFRPRIWGEANSPFMDLRDGFDAYRKRMRAGGSSLSQVERKARKMAREIAPLRFEFHTPDPEAFHALLCWKTQQHRRTRVLPVLQVQWVRRLLERVRLTDEDGFRGVFSVLYAGAQPAAVHLGLCSRTAMHIWFPAYNVEFEQYSPGLILLLELAKAASDRGLQRIDFGRGGERYKEDFKTGDTLIAEGSIDRRRLVRAMHRGWYHAKSTIRRSPWRTQLELPLIASRKLRQWLAFR